jgi:hypothetical protein
MTPHPKHANKEGIALIIVIGFLSVLLILAVAFVISMRTESLATRGYVDSIKSRQLMNVALARAMDDIEQDLTSNKLVYATWDAFGSRESSGSMSTNLLDDSASGYVPKSLLLAASQEGDQARWRDVVNNSGRVIGRYSYLAVDCSGFLDANNVGGLPRTVGIDSHEISPNNDLFPELLASPANENMWTEKYSSWIQYESLPELKSLGTTNTVFLSGSPSGLFPFSYFPAAQFLSYGPAPATGLPSNSLYIGGNDTYLSSPSVQPLIQTRFASMPVPGVSDPAMLTLNLLDYVDANNIPHNWASFCTEPTPLINEVVVSNRVTADPDGAVNTVYTNEYQLWVELWFPFHGITNTASYQLTVNAHYSGATPAEFNPPDVVNQVIPLDPLGGFWTDGSYFVTCSVRSVSGPLTNTVAVPNLNNAQVQLMLELREAAGIVDRFQNPGMIIPIRPVIAAFPAAVGVGKAANDPRLNWAAADTSQWVDVYSAFAPSTTLGAFNQGVARPNAAGCDGLSATNMYVRNGPLQTVGELGFLLQNNNSAGAWRTIRLLDDNVNNVLALPVLDRFTLVTSSYLKGLVNPNTFNANVLGAVFSGVRPERWPGENSAPLTAVQATNVAWAIITNTFAKGPYTNLSEIAKISAGSITNLLSGTLDLDPLQEEAIIRNSAGLLSPRQNLFTILLAAQTVDSVTNVAGEQRAVAVVWRDPYPTPNPYAPTTSNHAAFVRFFKVLAE